MCSCPLKAGNLSLYFKSRRGAWNGRTCTRIPPPTAYWVRLLTDTIGATHLLPRVGSLAI